VFQQLARLTKFDPLLQRDESGLRYQGTRKMTVWLDEKLAYRDRCDEKQ